MKEPMLFPKNNPCPRTLRDREEGAYQSGIEAAVKIAEEKGARFLFLAGPSCSGKSTTASALADAFARRGKRVLIFSTDDFFFDADAAPKNRDGTPNYDAFSHTDSQTIREVLNQFSQGKKTALPRFDFPSGKRIDGFLPISPNDWDAFLLEGIHALNDVILSALPPSVPEARFYLDVTRPLAVEGFEEDALSPKERRFCRRLIRDYKHRNADAQRTFSLWKGVVEMEKIILEPFQKNADWILSTDFSYEIPIEKEAVAALLSQLPPHSPDLAEAKKLMKKLSHFPSFASDWIPENSVLREFID